MSEPSGPDLARTRLGEILTFYGRAVLDDPRRFEALLRDLLGEHRREINLLVTSLKERVPQHLLASTNGVPASILVDQLAQRLHDHLGIAPEFATWTVETWAIALGVIASPRPKRASRAKAATPAAPSAPPPVGKASPRKTAAQATPPKARTAKAASSTQAQALPTQAATAPKATTAKTAAKTTRATKAPPIKAPRAKPPTTHPPPTTALRPQLIVGSTGAVDYRTLGEALMNIAPGGRILVQPGTYRESLTLDRPIELVGNGRAGEIILESRTSPCILTTAAHATVRNLTLTRRGTLERGEAVLVTNGQLTLHDCHITAQALACIAVRGAAASLVAQRCQVSDGSHTGVRFEDRATGSLDECDIHNHRYNGVHITDGANPTLTRVHIHHCEVGVLVNDTRPDGMVYGHMGRGTLTDCDIIDNEFQGVLISNGSPTLRRCRVQRNMDGIWVERNGAGSVVECDLSGNRRGAWYVKSGTVKHRGNRE